MNDRKPSDACDVHSSRRPACPAEHRDCPSDQEIEDFLCGRIDPGSADRLADVIDQCRACESFAAECESRLHVQWKALSGTDKPDHAVAGTVDRRSSESVEAGGTETIDPKKETRVDGWIGRYEIIGELGRGAMGEVFEGRHADLDRRVAIKLIRGLAPSDQQKLRFETETRAAAQLEHPNIVRVYEVGECQGSPYFVMQFVDGETLSQKVKGQPMAARQAAELVRTLAAAMQHAHTCNVIHRDIKPGNILIDHAGHVFITDFGLAKIQGSDSDLTHTGQALGTPTYMSPEQASGDKEEIDQRSDIYSLGAVLYTCLTGRPPHLAATPIATILQVRDADPLPPSQLSSDIPRDLENICLKSIEKQPALRYSSAGAMADDLSNFLDGKPILARPSSVVEKTIKWIRRRPLVATLIGFIGVSCIAGAVAISSMFYSSQLAESLSKTSAALDTAKAANLRAEQAEYFSQLAIAQLAWEQNDLSSMNAALNKAPAQYRDWEHAYLSSLPKSMIDTVENDGPVAGLIDVAQQDAVLSLRADRLDLVEVFNKRTLDLIRTIPTPERKSRNLILSNDGRKLCYRVANWRYVIADASSGERMGEMVVDGPLASGCFGPSDEIQAVISIPEKPWLPHRFEFWNVVKNKKLGSSTPFFGVSETIKLDPRGEWFAIGASDSIENAASYDSFSLVLFDAHSYELLRRVPVGASSVADIAISRDGDLIAVATSDHRIIVFNRRDFTIAKEIETHGAPYRICFSPEGSKLAMYSRIGRQWIALYDIASGQVDAFFRGHTDSPSGLVFDESGERLVTAAWDGNIHLWNTAGDPSRDELRGLTLPASHLAFSPTGEQVAGVQIGSIEEPGFVMTWNRRTATPLRKILGSQDYTANDATSSIYWISYLDESTLITLSWDNVLRYWNVESGEMTRSVSHPIEHGVHHAALSPNHLWAVSAGEKNVYLWDLAGGQVKQLELEMNMEGVCMDVEFSADGLQLLIGGGPGAKQGWLIVLDAFHATDASQQLFHFRDNGIQDIHAMPESQLVIGFSSGEVKLFDLATMKPIWTSQSHRGPIQEISVNHAGSRIATTGTDLNCVVHETATGTKLLQVQTNARVHPSVTCQLQFSPDDKTLAISAGKEIWLLNPLRKTEGVNDTDVSAKAKSPSNAKNGLGVPP